MSSRRRRAVATGHTRRIDTSRLGYVSASCDEITMTLSLLARDAQGKCVSRSRKTRP